MCVCVQETPCVELEFPWFNQTVVFPEEQQIEEHANWIISRELGYSYCLGLVHTLAHTNMVRMKSERNHVSLCEADQSCGV